MEAIGNSPCDANEGEGRKTQLRTLRQIAKQAAAACDFGAALLGLVEDADEEVGAEDFDDGDEDEVANVEVGDEYLQVLLGVESGVGAADEDGEADGDDESQDDPEECDEGDAGARA